MVELIRTLVEALTQGLPGLRGIQQEKRRRKLGAELFILYVRLNEAMLAADHIVRSLEIYVQRMGSHIARGDDRYALTAGNWIVGDVQKQIVNLTRISGLMTERGAALQIINPDAYNALHPLLSGKFNGLRVLLEIMRSGALPLGPTQEDIARATDFRDPAPRGRQHHMMSLMHELSPQWRESALTTSSEWGPSTYECVVQYLQERKPREQLTEIRTALEMLRAALEEHFTITDVLLEVGDSRLGSGSGGFID
ncbi:hypothetical protein ABII15_11290 [Streptomyces sp. HUAS MG91]|uniref:Uncharacterized protein n=1 Tax=Streptomyces tabacisoli TaxID=3156398 RepID=A0AAU8IRI7_9ACTN